MMKHAEHYEIKLPFLRLSQNPHESEAPNDAPFLVVGPKSPMRWRKSIESLACYFRRETGYDFPPYIAQETKYSNELGRDRVLAIHKKTLITDFVEVYYFVGAIGVRWREWDDAPSSWSLSWAWMHPYERRKGHMTRSWPHLLKMFPEPWIEYPLSDSMKCFLKKVDYMNVVEKRLQEVNERREKQAEAGMDSKGR
jgi:hypothetical protein